MSLDSIKRRLAPERESVKRDLNDSLLTLVSRIGYARQALSEGVQLDAHLIANAAMITELIARYNLIRDLTPHLDEESETLVPAAMAFNPLKPGTIVRIKHQPARDRSFQEGCRPARADFNNCTGFVVRHQTGHGLCYEVRIDGFKGSSCWYDAEELMVIP